MSAILICWVFPGFSGVCIVSSTKRMAVSYSRWSKKEQGSGDSRKRQQDQFLAFCRAHDLEPLPDEEHPVDDWVSAFKGKNFDKGSLGRFIERVKEDRGLKGVVLVVESQDRISRASPLEAIIKINMM